MRKYLQAKVFEFSYYLELLISIVLVAVIGVLTVKLAINILPIINSEQENVLNMMLGQAMTLAVGVEFVKMLCKHTPGTVIEVLLFAIARQMVVEHSTALETLVGVLAIAVLFGTRKFLFCNFDEADRAIFRATQNIKLVGRMAKVHIPGAPEDKLGGVIVKKLIEQDDTISIGACANFEDFALRVDNMHGDEITRIELIKFK